MERSPRPSAGLVCRQEGSLSKLERRHTKAGPDVGHDCPGSSGQGEAGFELGDRQVLDDLPSRESIEVFLAAAILGKIEERGRNREAHLFHGGDQVIAALNPEAGVAEGVVAHARNDG